MSKDDDTRARQLKDLVDRLRVAPGAKVTLQRDFDPTLTSGWLEREDAAEYLEMTSSRLG